MALDDADGMAALLWTAHARLEERVRPELEGGARLEAAMIARALALAARALGSRDISWSAYDTDNSASPAQDRPRATSTLREHVRARLAVTNPGYIDEIHGAPP